MSANDYDVIVIGAGMGGLTAAAVLQRNGYKVLVCEQNSEIGGCCTSYEVKGFIVDQGVTALDQVVAIDEFFQQCRLNRGDYLDLVACDPVVGLFFPDGSKETFPRSIDGMVEAIGSWSLEDAKAYRRFVKEIVRPSEQAMKDFMFFPLSSPRDVIDLMRRWSGGLKTAGGMLKSYRTVFEEYFKHPRTLAPFLSRSIRFGMSPRSCPGILALAASATHQRSYYPRGGMSKIPEAFAQVLTEAGGEIRTETKVENIIVSGKQAIGVTLADGSQIKSRYVVSNINARTAYEELIGLGNLSGFSSKAIQGYKYSVSMPLVNLILNKKPELPAHFNLPLCDPDEIERQFYFKYQAGRFPETLLGLISCPTMTDPDLAPKNKQILNVLTMADFYLRDKHWDNCKEEYMDHVVDLLEKGPLPGISKMISHRYITTPLDFSRRLLTPEGAIYGLQNNLWSIGCFRPSNRSRSINNFFLTGASTHPGSGLQMVIASGLVTAKLMMRD